VSEPVRNIVDKSFWEEEYLDAAELPARPDPSFPFDRMLAHELERRAPVAAGRTVMEVGCAPGKWLVWYAERFGANVEGVEYGEKGVAATRANFDAAGVDGAVHHADFFEFDPRPYDLVLSLGFIEHFDDTSAAFARHVEFVAPGGLLAIGVPNYRGLNRVVQRFSDPSHLALHNLGAMDPALYESLAAAHDLRVESIAHVGGFDPVIIKIGRPAVKPWIALEGRWRRLAVSERVNHRLASSYLLAVFRR
jgi:2-polyprenyl-3-methyl-5-hydroxy-6-metoxy-1,4-benzoquinol methylase